MVGAGGDAAHLPEAAGGSCAAAGGPWQGGPGLAGQPGSGGRSREEGDGGGRCRAGREAVAVSGLTRSRLVTALAKNCADGPGYVLGAEDEQARNDLNVRALPRLRAREAAGGLHRSPGRVEKISSRYN